MLDISQIRNSPEAVKNALLKRMESVDFTELLMWDEERRSQKRRIDELRASRNEASKQIGVIKREGKDGARLQEEVRGISQKIAELEGSLTGLEEKISEFLLALPNIPDDDVAAGGKENNAVIGVWGVKPTIGPDAKDHMQLATALGLIDYERGAKLGGRGFWIYTADGAQLEWALLNYFNTFHSENGYTFLLLPHILLEECGYGAGQFPKFAEDVFHLQVGEGERPRFLLPTAETAIANLHRDEILDASMLPLKYFSYTPCYRREAGSYRTSERGMVRGHQFNKVEIFRVVTPEQSDQALEEMLDEAERLVQGLGLHYRNSQLAAEDCSAAMAKTIDIEVWIPSMNEYKEVSSVSIAREYQARRTNTRYKEKGGKKTAYVHTLNASGLATSRVIPAILEQYQQQDGSVVVPKVLRPWVRKDVISASV